MSQGDTKKVLNFEISSFVVKQLGEQLISDEVTALTELVKNSYDADASYVNIEINTERQTSGSSNDEAAINEDAYIVIEDDGTGMSSDDIERGWLKIAISEKRRVKMRGASSRKYGRTPLGDKGLGRLSAQRLGSKLELYSVKELLSETGEHLGFVNDIQSLAVDWSLFEETTLLKDIPITLTSTPRVREKGTKLIIRSLRDPSKWMGDARNKLLRSLSQMIFPFGKNKEFRMYLSINGESIELEQISKSIRKAAISNHQFEVSDEKIIIQNSMKLSIFKEQGEKGDFERFIEIDHGKGFFDFISKSKKYKINNLELSKGEWPLESKVELDIGDLSTLIYDEDGCLYHPGPFSGEIDNFSYKEYTRDDSSSLFEDFSHYRQYITNHSGIRIYRDGFGIRPYGWDNNDWLKLGSGTTSGRSFYGLRPRNVIGYVSVSASENLLLEEKTDREGFSATPYSHNFMEIMDAIIRPINILFASLKRGYIEYKVQTSSGKSGVSSTKNAIKKMRELSEETVDLSENLLKHNEELEALSVSVRQTLENIDNLPLFVKEEERRSEGWLSGFLGKVKGLLSFFDKVDESTKKAQDIQDIADYLENQIETLQIQLREFSELAGLGLTAEALSHELANVADRLAIETNKVTSSVRRRKQVDSYINIYLEYVQSSISSIRKQISHLAPSLKYVREKSEDIDLYHALEELIEYYAGLEKFKGSEIELELSMKGDDFIVSYNKGKLTQVFDNIILNAEFWLSEYKRRNASFSPLISIIIIPPFVEIYDNGKGIDKSIEETLFQPFVTTKPKGKGRGLGLFIVEQLLESSGCSVSLKPELNQHGRKYKFLLDFSSIAYGE